MPLQQESVVALQPLVPFLQGGGGWTLVRGWLQCLKPGTWRGARPLCSLWPACVLGAWKAVLPCGLTWGAEKSPPRQGCSQQEIPPCLGKGFPAIISFLGGDLRLAHSCRLSHCFGCSWAGRTSSAWPCCPLALLAGGAGKLVLLHPHSKAWEHSVATGGGLSLLREGSLASLLLGIVAGGW